MIGETTPRKFKGDHLVPVRDLLASNLIQLPHRAGEEIGRFVDAVRAIQQLGLRPENG